MNDTATSIPKARFGGRAQNELRPLSLQTGLLSKSNGSCKFSMHATQVLASIRGPVQPSSSKKELIDRANVEVFVKAVQMAQSSNAGAVKSTQSKERELEAAIKGVLEQVCLLEQFPRTIVSVNIQVISSDGSLLTCATMAAVCAAMDAGIPLKHIPSCASCALQRHGKATRYLLDPDALEEHAADALVHVCLSNDAGATTNGDGEISTLSTLLSVQTKGVINEEELSHALKVVESGAAAVSTFVSMSLKKAIFARLEMESDR